MMVFVGNVFLITTLCGMMDFYNHSYYFSVFSLVFSFWLMFRADTKLGMWNGKFETL